jgi:hypothetical protein
MRVHENLTCLSGEDAIGTAPVFRRLISPQPGRKHDDRRIGASAATELDVWRAALFAGLISGLPVADEQGGQVLPRGLHVEWVDEDSEPSLE